MATDLLDNSIKETDLGPLPSEWSVESLGTIIDKPQYGLTATADQKPVGPKFLRITDIQDDRVEWGSVPFCPCSQEDKPKYALKAGDLVIARIGATTGKAFLIRDTVDAVFASYLIRIRPSSHLVPDYLNQFTKSDFYRAQINATKGGRLKQGVNIPGLQDLLIPVPPLAEQQAIAHVLRTVQRAKEATEKVIAAARKLKQSLMRHLFTYGPVPVEQADQVPLKETEIGPIPERWKVVELGDHARLATGGTPSRETPEFWNGGIPWVKTGEINYRTIETTEETISKEGLAHSNARLFPVGTLLTAMYGQGVTRGRIGILGIEATTNQACAALFPGGHLDRDFLYYTFVFGYERIREMGHGANQRNLSMSMLKTVKLGLPPISDQKQIAKLLLPVDRKLAIEENKRNALDTLFRTLLHHLMTGKVRVNELEFPAIKEGSP